MYILFFLIRHSKKSGECKMELLNVEIKAKCSQHEKIRNILKELDADFKGTDHQIDTYYRVRNGRLKLREGNIEQSLIHYHREDISEPKQSKVLLYKTESDSFLKKILTRSLGVWVVVDKTREIYFVDNVKFHLDIVKYLGTFLEIEAIDKDGAIGKEKLQNQCMSYLNKFDIKESDLIALSYSDLLYSSNK